MNIVTSGDSGFFHCLKELSESVKKYYGKSVIIYDIGLTEDEKKQLDAVIIPLNVTDKVNHKGRSLLSSTGIPSTRATHKPFCVMKYFEDYSEPMILVDADCLFMARVEETGFDVGVTCYKSKKKDIDFYNGIINSGVIFFNSPAEELVNQWAKECEKENTTDQKALSDILDKVIDWSIYNRNQDYNGLKVRILNAKIYNDFHLTKKSRILHFINTKHQKDIYEKLIDGFKQGKDIRKMFRQIKRGKKSKIETILDAAANLFKRKH